jgi:hypothetical protein
MLRKARVSLIGLRDESLWCNLAPGALDKLPERFRRDVLQVDIRLLLRPQSQNLVLEPKVWMSTMAAFSGRDKAMFESW